MIFVIRQKLSKITKRYYSFKRKFIMTNRLIDKLNKKCDKKNKIREY